MWSERGAKAHGEAGTLPGTWERGRAPGSISEMSATSGKEGTPNFSFLGHPPLSASQISQEGPFSVPLPQATLAQALCHPPTLVRLPEMGTVSRATSVSSMSGTGPGTQ